MTARLVVALLALSMLTAGCGEPMPPTGTAIQATATVDDRTNRLTPEAITVYDNGAVEQLAPGSEPFTQAGDAAEQLLRRVPASGMAGEPDYVTPENVQDYVDRIKKYKPVGESQARAVEVIYAKSSALVGGADRFSAVFVPWDIRRPDRDPESRSIPLFLGNPEYDRSIRTQPIGVRENLVSVLNAALLRPGFPPSSLPGSSDGSVVFRLAQDFYNALIFHHLYAGDKLASQSYQAAARLHLTPELNARVTNIEDLPLLAFMSRSRSTDIGWSGMPEISGDRAAVEAVVTNDAYVSAEPDSRTVRFEFVRQGNQWRIGSIKFNHKAVGG